MITVRLLILLLVSVLTAGCGYNPDSEVYDTRLNVEQFPEEALTLIDGVQSNTLDSYEKLIEAFSNLYLSHAELLDNVEWVWVVERLGVKFRVKGDEWVDRGLPSYATAAKFYDLACQARPTDQKVRYKRDLFGTWAQAIDDSLVPAGFDPVKDTLGMPALLDVMKYFLLGDSLHRTFGRNHLMPQLFGLRSLEKTFTSSVTRTLTTTDKAFLSYIGVRKEPMETPMVKLTDPHIDMVTAQIDKQNNHWYAAELYFVPREPLPTNYWVAIRVAAPVSATGANLLGPHLLSFDFHPEVPSTQWPVGKVAAVYRRFSYFGESAPVAVGLYAKQGDTLRYLHTEHSGEPLHILPASIFTQ